MDYYDFSGGVAVGCDFGWGFDINDSKFVNTILTNASFEKNNMRNCNF